MCLIPTRGETADYLKEFVAEAEAHFNLKPSKISCGNGVEYRNKFEKGT